MEFKVRGGRTLLGNSSVAIPRHIIAVDTETIPVLIAGHSRKRGHKFRLGCAIATRISRGKQSGTYTARLHSPEDFWELIVSESRSGQTTWIVAHNALFDFIVLDFPHRFERGDCVVDWPRTKRSKGSETARELRTGAVAVIDSPPTIVAFRIVCNDARCVFVDTLNWFRSPLADLGEMVGLPKFNMPAFRDHDDTWYDYCRRDCEIVMAAFSGLIDFVASHDLGMFRYTAPAQAMSAFRHRLMPHKIFYHDVDQHKHFERQGYYGGRSEVFKMGPIKTTVYKLDVSSLYPSVMRGNKYPYTLESFEHRQDYLSFPPPHDLSECICEVEINTHNSVYPLRLHTGTIYPVGRFFTTLCGPELVVAATNGDIVGYKNWQRYKTDLLFDKYVDYFWNLRLQFERQGNRVYSDLCKTFLNSFYGKFSQRSAQWENDSKETVGVPWSTWTKIRLPLGTTDYYRSFGYTAQRFVGLGEKCGTLPAISAFVTSYGRVFMNHLRSICGKNNVLYQGVDSLIVTESGYGSLLLADEVHDRQLGKLRLEKVSLTGEIKGIGDYVLDGCVTLAGRSARVEEDENGVLLQRKFHTLSNMFRGRPLDYVEENSTEWKRQGKYWKGVVGKDGWITPVQLTPDTVSVACADS